MSRYYRSFLEESGVAPSYLLDTYSGATAGYSLRKLSSTYSGNCIRVRRSSDNTEQDFGFVSNALDTASLLTFVGSGNGFVTTWYDQSGLSRNAIQTTALSQPSIISSGILNLLNGKPSVLFYNYFMTFTEITSTNGIEIFSVNNFLNIDSGGTPYLLNSIVLAYTGGFTSDFAIGAYNNKMAIYSENNNSVGLQTLTSINLNTQYLANGYASASSTGVGFNNSNYATGSGQRNDLKVRAISKDGASGYFNGYVNEIVIYPTVQPTNRSNINTNINTHYAIY